MKKGFILSEDGEERFWVVDYSGNDYALIRGKIGGIPESEICDFDTNEECVAEAEALISDIESQGYEEDINFDFDKMIYIDDYNYGISIKTSHPVYVEHFKDEIYYDESDEQFLFGSDNGNDTLLAIYEQISEDEEIDFIGFPEFLISEEWGMKYFEPDLNPDNIRDLKDKYEMDLIQSDMITYATAFAEIKITGMIEDKVRKKGLDALKRFQIVTYNEDSSAINQMIADLESFRNNTPILL